MNNMSSLRLIRLYKCVLYKLITKFVTVKIKIMNGVKLPKPFCVLFLGPPGAGKGTYASKISAKYNIPHISTGDMIRSEIKQDSRLGREFQEYSKSGRLVPDELVNEIAKLATIVFE
eukprot:GHVL01014633.1.p1 GENE.GHVL01014633.1~~GHVL01014633.1.p1  ORF type:complete len:117 (+),score=7.93 GHVL01014633.1:111-461(+)